MGFDNECIINIQSLAGEYFCPVCRTLVYPHEALQTQCTHLYCKPCLTYVVSSTQACPYDGYLVTEAGSKPLMESNKALGETIGKTIVHCLYHRSGCMWQGPLSDCTTHCLGCAFGNSLVVCNRCAIQIVHRQWQEHAQTCNVNGTNTQLQQGSETAQDPAVSGAADQSKIGNQVAAPSSNQPHASHTATTPSSAQNSNLPATANPSWTASSSSSSINNMDLPQPASSTVSSSSIDTDELLHLQREILVWLVRKVYGSTASSSRREPRAGNIERGRVAANERLLRDYFGNNPVYTPDMFRRRFRMSRQLFERIVDDLEGGYPYFTLRVDGRYKQGFSPIQKCTSAIRQLAYGVAADSLDEYLRMGDKTSRDCLHKFCTGIIELYGKKYLRKPTYVDIQKLYTAHEAKHGFPGMLGSIDCTHWAWANCPVAWRGQFMRGDHEHPTIMLEAVASHDLWIWHAYFGVAGSNDINVLNQSSIFNDLYDGKAPECPFEVNEVTYNHGYYLADGIYPEWATFVKSFTCPHDDKRKKFKSAQESARKDVERAFGVLKQRWHILHNPARRWHPTRLGNIMYACVILHNMILEDEDHAICGVDENDLVADDIETQISEEQRAANVQEVKNRETHNNLRSDLVEHISRIRLPNNDDD